MAETWYLRSVAGEYCDPGDHESLSLLSGAVFAEKMIDLVGDTWNYREPSFRRIEAGIWQVFLDVASGFPGTINVKVQRRSADCVLLQTHIDEDVPFPGGAIEIFTTAVNPGEIEFAEGEMLVFIITRVGVVLVSVRYNLPFALANSHLIRPNSAPFVPPGPTIAERTLEIPPGTCGDTRRIITVAASDDAQVVGLGAGWTPPFDVAVNPAPTGAVAVAKDVVGAGFGVAEYVVSFDTAFLIEQVERVASAKLLLRCLGVPADDDGRSLKNDAHLWGADAAAADFAASDQPGADGEALLSELVEGRDVELDCRRWVIIPDGDTQFRLTVSGEAPAGENRVEVGSIAGYLPEVAPRLELVVEQRMPLWEMRLW